MVDAEAIEALPPASLSAALDLLPERGAPALGAASFDAADRSQQRRDAWRTRLDECAAKSATNWKDVGSRYATASLGITEDGENSAQPLKARQITQSFDLRKLPHAFPVALAFQGRGTQEAWTSGRQSFAVVYLAGRRQGPRFQPASKLISHHCDSATLQKRNELRRGLSALRKRKQARQQGRAFTG
eukprot:g18317.t1